MTKIKVLVIVIALTIGGFCQIASAQYFGLTSKDTVLKYAFELGGKDVGAFMTKEVYNVTQSGDNEMVVEYLYKLLNKKGKTHVSAKMMGMGEGLILPVKYDDGSYYLTMDFIFCQTDNRMGYLMIVPAEMSVGQTLEGGRFQSTAQLPLGGTVKNDITFSDLTVKDKVNLTLRDGSEIECYLIEGKAIGNAYKSKQDSIIRLWFAKGIGIVKEEVEKYINTKKAYTATLVEIAK